MKNARYIINPITETVRSRENLLKNYFTSKNNLGSVVLTG
jgi:hypothetical protein